MSPPAPPPIRWYAAGNRQRRCKSVRWLCAAVGLVVCLEAQAQNPDAIRAAMQPSLEKQKESVRRQVGTAVPVAASVAGAPATAAPATAAPATGAPVAAAPVASPVAAAPASFFTVAWPAPADFAAALAAAPPDCDPLPAKDVSALVDSAAKQEGVKAELIRAVMEQESAFKPCALSAKGAQGLMQLMPETAHEMGIENRQDPWENLYAGAKYLSQQVARFDSLEKAVAAYNAGPSAVEAHQGVPPYSETRAYVQRVMDTKARLDLLKPEDA